MLFDPSDVSDQYDRSVDETLQREDARRREYIRIVPRGRFVRFHAIARVVHLVFADSRNSTRCRVFSPESRIRSRAHSSMPFAGGADKCIVLLKGQSLMSMPGKNEGARDDVVDEDAKGSTWIIFEEPKWVEYEDELVVVAKCVER